MGRLDRLPMELSVEREARRRVERHVGCEARQLALQARLREAGGVSRIRMRGLVAQLCVDGSPHKRPSAMRLVTIVGGGHRRVEGAEAACLHRLLLLLCLLHRLLLLLHCLLLLRLLLHRLLLLLRLLLLRLLLLLLLLLLLRLLLLRARSRGLLQPPSTRHAQPVRVGR